LATVLPLSTTAIVVREEVCVKAKMIAVIIYLANNERKE
jgi:hypothetical protein